MNINIYICLIILYNKIIERKLIYKYLLLLHSSKWLSFCQEYHQALLILSRLLPTTCVVTSKMLAVLGPIEKDQQVFGQTAVHPVQRGFQNSGTRELWMSTD